MVSAPKEQRAPSPGQHPGYKGVKDKHPIGAKALSCCWAFALTGRERGARFTQGVALGYGLIGLSGRSAA